jgi:hypothetical protein
MVKIISDELITQINDQLKASVNEMIKRELTDYLQNIDWSQEIDLGGMLQDDLQTIIHDEIRNMDLINDFRDEISEVVNEEIDSVLSELVISRA